MLRPDSFSAAPPCENIPKLVSYSDGWEVVAQSVRLSAFLQAVIRRAFCDLRWTGNSIMALPETPKGSSLAGALPGKAAIETGRNVWNLDHSDHERQTHPFAKAALTHSFGIVSACFHRLLTAKKTKAVLGF